MFVTSGRLVRCWDLVSFFFTDGRDLSEKEVLGVFLFSPVAFAFGETDL